MPMSFTFSSTLQHFLFYNWAVNSAGGLTGICLISALLSGILQWIKRLENKYQLNFQYTSRDIYTPISINSGSCSKLQRVTICTALYLVQIVLDYLLMLSVMTFNAWLTIAVVLGAGVGYLAFAKTNSINTAFLTLVNESSEISEPEPSVVHSDEILVH